MSNQYPSRETGVGTPPSPLTRVRRKPSRASYETATVHAVIDAALISHAATVRHGRPLVLPMVHGRIEDMLYLHGSAAAGLFRDAGAGSPVCVTATILDGLVLGRSARNHSMNYRSVTIHGTAEHVTDPQEILNGLQAIVNHVVAGRWDQVRKPTSYEIRETGLWRLPLAQASVKARTGSTLDPDSDRTIPVWAGVIPTRITFGTPVPAEGVAIEAGPKITGIR